MTRLCQTDGCEVSLADRHKNALYCYACAAERHGRASLRSWRQKAGWSKQRLIEPSSGQMVGRRSDRVERIEAMLIEDPALESKEVAKALGTTSSAVGQALRISGTTMRDLRREVISGYYQRIPEDAG